MQHESDTFPDPDKPVERRESLEGAESPDPALQFLRLVAEIKRRRRAERVPEALVEELREVMRDVRLEGVLDDVRRHLVEQEERESESTSSQD